MHSRLTCLVLTIFIALSAQDCFATQWAKSYGGDSVQYVRSLMETSDAGYILAGYVEHSPEDTDGFVMKLDRNGTLSWMKTYPAPEIERFNSIQQTTGGDFIVAGYTNSFGTAMDTWILKLDANGNVIWQKAYGSDRNDNAHAVQQTVDGGYFVAGSTISFGATEFDFWVMELNQEGAIIWQKRYGGAGIDLARATIQTADGGFMVAGLTDSFGAGDKDLWVLKLDANGNVIWQKTYGGSAYDAAWSIYQTFDGGYILAGTTASFPQSGYSDPADMWVLKLDPSGNVSWSKTYGGLDLDSAKSMQQTKDGGFIVYGYASSFEDPTNVDFLILKLDSSGNPTWQKTYGGSNHEVVLDGTAVQQTVDGGFVVGGRTLSFGNHKDTWVLKVDNSGEINNCDIIGTSDVNIKDVSVFRLDTSVVGQTTTAGIIPTTVVPTDNNPITTIQCFAPDWFSMEPPSQDKLNGVWGYVSTGSSHQFYAVGESGTIVHFDGTSWSETVMRPTSNDLNGIWGSSENGILTDIFAVGDNATVFHYDEENGWEDISPTSFTNALNDIWGSSSDDVYAVGDGGKIAHYNGTSWSEVTSPTTDKLTSIWGSSASDYHAVGEGGRIIRYNGSWSTVTSPTSNDLSEVWGSASDNIYAVGKLGTIIHYDGTDWLEVESPTSATLNGIWGSSAENIFAVGEHGTILYYDGVSWQKMDSGSQDTLISTFGTLNPRVMIVGYGILSLGGPSVQGRICDSCSGEPINEVTVTFNQGGDPEQIKETDELGIYPTISSWGDGAKDILFTAADHITKEITVDLPNNSSIVDHATYLLPSSHADCISGTVTKTVQIGLEGMERDNKRGVQNMEVKLYPGSEEDQSTVTDVGGNFFLLVFLPGHIR